jgi:soluble cytochrome b562
MSKGMLGSEKRDYQELESSRRARYEDTQLIKGLQKTIEELRGAIQHSEEKQADRFDSGLKAAEEAAEEATSKHTTLKGEVSSLRELVEQSTEDLRGAIRHSEQKQVKHFNSGLEGAVGGLDDLKAKVVSMLELVREHGAAARETSASELLKQTVTDLAISQRFCCAGPGTGS